ncbi:MULTISPECIES: lipase family protein [unclassified Enterococcus]|uniref:lipase family protein n=1 Tax=unclassified Enterococcus TaxID=2608891 RepID=UPI003F24C9AB
MDQNRWLSDSVYKVEDGLIKVNHLVKEIPYIVIKTVDTNKEKIGNESKPKKNSMQAMVVAKIKEEYLGYNEEQLKKVPGFPDSVITKNLTIAYAGTTSLKDWYTNLEEIGRSNKHSNGAFASALNYAHEIKKQYPKSDGYTISTTGHSLGGAKALFVAAINGYDSVTYGAAGPGLAQALFDNHNGTLINIYNTSDVVTSGLFTGGKGMLPINSFGIDNSGWETFGHSLDQFRTYEEGNYIDKHGQIIVYVDGNGGILLAPTLWQQTLLENEAMIKLLAVSGEHTLDEIKRVKEENEWLKVQIKEFLTLKELQQKLSASGGGLSQSEKIYLEDSQALAVVRTAASKFDEAMSNVRVIYQNGITELEELWNDWLGRVRNYTPHLTYNEVIETLAEVNCTKWEIVDEPTQEFRDKIRQIDQMSEQFQTLADEITQKINEMVARDKELANQLF